MKGGENMCNDPKYIEDDLSIIMQDSSSDMINGVDSLIGCCNENAVLLGFETFSKKTESQNEEK